MNTKNPLLSLFYASFVIQFVGYGLFPFLPLYATEFGANSATVGLYLALTYLAITVGSALPGWLPLSLSRKRLFVANGLLGVPALLLWGQATALWQVMVLTAVVWFSGGVGLTLVSVYTGLVSSRRHRGRAYSFISMSGPLSALIAGLVIGQIVTHLGYSALFVALATLWTTLPLVVFFKLEDVLARHGGQQARETKAATPSANPGFSLLLVAAMLAAGTVSIGRMGASLSMGRLAFSAAAISSTSSVAGLLMIPFVLLMGTLSDRLGSRRFLTLGHLLTGAGVLILIAATQLWHFWMAMAVMLMGRAIDEAMAPTIAAELLPPTALQRHLPKLKAINWMAGVASFVGAGYALERVGAASVFLAAAMLALTAALLLHLLPMLQGKSKLPRLFQRQSAAPIVVPCSQGCV